MSRARLAPGWKETLPLALAIFLLTAACFWPILQNGFLDWDDDSKLLRNPFYRGFGWDNIKWMFSTHTGSHFYPLTWLSFAADFKLWGMDPKGYHLTSLLLHAAGAVAFFYVCLRLFILTGLPGSLRLSAAFAALVFALHPLRVESVAWATERSDVLSGLFYLLTILYYLRAHSDRSRPAYPSAAFGFFILSLLSKSIGVTLPLTLILLDVYPLGRLPGDPRKWLQKDSRPVLYQKIPYLLAALAFAVMATLVQFRPGNLWSLEKLSVLGRLASASYGAIFYIQKTVLPTGLLPLYPMPENISLFAPVYLASAAAVVGLTAVFYLLRRTRPALFAAWLFFLITLLPVLGLIKTGPQIAADRYTYLACLSWAALAGAGYGMLQATRFRLFAAGAAAGLVFFLGAFAASQTKVWHDSETFWSYMVKADPRHHVGRSYLGSIKARRGDTAAAISLFEDALRIRPSYGAAHNNLANILANLGRYDQAVAHYRAALEASPQHRAINYNWGVALARAGKSGEAEDRFRAELRLNPRHADSYKALGEIALMQGNDDEAVMLFERASALDPRNASIRALLETALDQP